MSFEELQYLLNMNAGKELKKLSVPVSPGLVVIAPYVDVEGCMSFYRGRVERVSQDGSQVKAKVCIIFLFFITEIKSLTAHDVISIMFSVLQVFFVDYGNTDYIPVSDLRAVDNRLIRHGILDVPCKALECILSHVKPAPWKCPDGIWSQEAKDYVEDWINDHGHGQTQELKLFGRVSTTFHESSL